jgi:hypothetical protein
MCSCTGIRHWITQSSIMPFDSSVANQSGSVRLPQESR